MNEECLYIRRNRKIWICVVYIGVRRLGRVRFEFDMARNNRNEHLFWRQFRYIC